jgi:cobalt-zinc-cadmium efflux system protein
LFYILYEAYQRFINPQPLSENSIIIVASTGIAVNFISAYLFRKNQHDVNVKGAYLHLMMDAFISVGVVVAALGIKFTGYTVLDPIAACLIVVFIAREAGKLLRESFILLVGGVPTRIEIEKVREMILNQPAVAEIHDIRTKDQKHPGDAFLAALNSALRDKFKISHVTIQIEIGDASQACELDHKC